MKKIKLLLLTLLLSLTSCGQKDDYKLTILSPSGAPAIAIAGAPLGDTIVNL